MSYRISLCGLAQKITQLIMHDFMQHMVFRAEKYRGSKEALKITTLPGKCFIDQRKQRKRGTICQHENIIPAVAEASWLGAAFCLWAWTACCQWGGKWIPKLNPSQGHWKTGKIKEKRYQMCVHSKSSPQKMEGWKDPSCFINFICFSS